MKIYIYKKYIKNKYEICIYEYSKVNYIKKYLLLKL